MKIILAVDGTIEADLAGAIANKLPFPQETEFLVATVIENYSGIPGTLIPQSLGKTDGTIAETWLVQRQVASNMLTQAVNQLGTGGRKALPALLEGDAAEQLLKLIQDSHASTVVVGCGAGDFKAFFLGSVSRKLVLYSQASVIVGRRYKNIPNNGCYSYLDSKEKLDVILAVDESEGSELAVKTLEKVGRPAFGRLYTLCVEPIMKTWMGMDPASLLQPSSEEHKKYLRVAETVAERLCTCAEKVLPITSIGRPSAQIISEAEAHNVDLIMLGASRYSAIERFILGSCAYETAIHAPCSVMIFREVLPFCV